MIISFINNKVYTGTLRQLELPKCVRHLVDVYVWNVDTEVPKPLVGLLSTQEMRRSSQLKLLKHQKMYQNAHGVLRLIIAKYLNLPAHQLSFETNAFGKPYISPVQNTLAIHFNLSHTVHYAACAISRYIPVGIDIESANRTFEHHFINELLRPKEKQKYVNEMPVTASQLIQLWTIKEAWLKHDGKGIAQLHHVPDLSLYDFELAKFATTYSIENKKLITCVLEKNHIISVVF